MLLESVGSTSKPGVIARRPAAPAAGALIVGVFIHSLVPIAPLGWTIALAGIVAAAIGLRRHERLRAAAILLAMTVAGVATAQATAYRYPRDHISAFATDEPRLAQLELSLDHPPRTLTWPYGQYRALPPKQVTTASVRAVKTWSGWAPASGDVLVQIAQPHPRLRQGQIIRAVGRLERPGPAMNPGQFDWAGYYREQRILVSLQIAEAESIQILSRQRISPTAWLRAQARRALARGFDLNDSLEHALLRALLLGDSDPELRDVQEQFRRTGTSHHLAISGMHVAVLGGVVFGVCRLLRASPRTACWAALILVVLYGIVALPSPPVVRSVVLCVAFALGILQRRTTDAIQLLSLSVIAMLIYHPLDLFNAGFQLSFGTVLGLMLFTRPLMSLMPGRDIDEQIAASMRQPTRLALLRERAVRAAKATLAAAIVAWVVSMPMIALHFEQLNPYAIPASILLAPIVFLALIGGFAKVLLTLLLPSGAPVWAGFAVMPVTWMRQIVDWLATFPGAEVPLPAPPVWVVILSYALMLALIVPVPWRIARWTLRGAAVGGCLLLAVLTVQARFASIRSHASDLRVTLLAVGAGQCAVIEPPGADAVLVDAGSATLSDVLRKVLGPFLRHQGRRDIDSIFITHANFDHFSAVAEIVTAYDVRRLYVSPHFRGHSIGNPPAEALLRSLDALDRPPRQIAAGERFDLGGGATLETLWPHRVTALDANNTSLVMRLTFAGRTVLLTGDLESRAQRELLSNRDALRADVLVAPHHGSFENTTVEFVQAVSPGAIICSNDRTLSVKQRQFDSAMKGRNVLRTHTSGAVTVRITPAGQVNVEPFLDVAE